MKILLVNGSPKRKGSASQTILDKFRAELSGPNEFQEVMTVKPGPIPDGFEADLILVAFPLYVDSLPSGLIQWLVEFAGALNQRAHKRIPLLAVCNCGFYEGEQTRPGLEILRNFCQSTGLTWAGGLGIGTGGMISALKDVPDRAWIKKAVSAALGRMTKTAENLLQGKPEEPPEMLYVQHGIPRWAYRLAGQGQWRKEIRRNGLPMSAFRSRPLDPA